MYAPVDGGAAPQGALWLSLRSLVRLVVAAGIFAAGWLAAIALNKPAGAASRAGPMLYDTLLVFGDSNTQYAYDLDIKGFVSQLANLYQRQMDVINRGFSGFNTSSALGVAGSVFPVTQPGKRLGKPVGKRDRLWPETGDTFPRAESTVQLCILAFGTNDAAAAPSTQHNPIEKYEQEMRQLVAMLRDPESAHYSLETRILIVTPPPVSDSMVKAMAAKDPDYIPASHSAAKQYAEVAVRVANQTSVAVVDLNAEIDRLVAGQNTTSDHAGKHGGYDTYLVDGVHLSATGNNVLYKLIVSQIKRQWPEILPERPRRATGPKA
ncbi:isoamyl acetate-hydrolyzing esterase [Coemansia javaensis]|uniref:Isoamyl acetate-hydrolyzing esterase n=1 Tax=Coemansia javaensis TaxID=2761396 RepID=A0A9W8LLA2_9FUNG|nr:isoamyl acetate-hydrolyzing esterase [Coemansia javaensis]